MSAACFCLIMLQAAKQQNRAKLGRSEIKIVETNFAKRLRLCAA